MEKQIDIKSINLEPNNTSAWQIAGKVAIGLVVWLMMSFLVFAITVVFNTVIQSGIQAIDANGQMTGNPVLPIVFLLIAFITSLIGNIIIAATNSFLNPSRYYDIGKMLSLISISNIIIFFVIAPVYMIFWNNILGLFIIVWFHNIFSVFVSYSIMEHTTNPNYSVSTLIGTTFGMCVFLVMFLAFYNSFNSSDLGLDTANTQKIKLLISIPPLLSYTLMPLCYSLWEKLYYKFYEMGNDFLYIPSLSDVVIDPADKSIIESNNKTAEVDINVDI